MGGGGAGGGGGGGYVAESEVQGGLTWGPHWAWGSWLFSGGGPGGEPAGYPTC